MSCFVFLFCDCGGRLCQTATSRGASGTAVERVAVVVGRRPAARVCPPTRTGRRPRPARPVPHRRRRVQTPRAAFPHWFGGGGGHLAYSGLPLMAQSSRAATAVKNAWGVSFKRVGTPRHHAGEDGRAMRRPRRALIPQLFVRPCQPQCLRGRLDAPRRWASRRVATRGRGGVPVAHVRGHPAQLPRQCVHCGRGGGRHAGCADGRRLRGSGWTSHVSGPPPQPSTALAPPAENSSRSSTPPPATAAAADTATAWPAATTSSTPPDASAASQLPVAPPPPTRGGEWQRPDAAASTTGHAVSGVQGCERRSRILPPALRVDGRGGRWRGGKACCWSRPAAQRRH